MKVVGVSSERVVLVTGGSRGIGAAIVAQLANRGVRVGCGYANSEAAATELAVRWPGLVTPVRYVLGDADSALESAAQLAARFGRLDGVIANAGVWSGGRLVAMREPDWNRVVADNVQGVAQLGRSALPYLARAPGASFTIISSVIGLIGGPGDTAYAAAKGALFGFGRALAKEAAGDGIRVNVLAPGFVETDMTAQVPAASRRKIADQILLGRFGTADEIASAAVYLSEDATYCTGSILTMDGGWSI